MLIVPAIKYRGSGLRNCGLILNPTSCRTLFSRELLAHVAIDNDTSLSQNLSSTFLTKSFGPFLFLIFESNTKSNTIPIFFPFIFPILVMI